MARNRVMLIAAVLAVVAGVLLLVRPWHADPAPADEVTFQPHGGVKTGSGPASTRAGAPTSRSGEVKPAPPTVVDAVLQEDIDKAVVTYSPEALPVFERLLASNEPDVRDAARDGLLRLGEKGGAALLRHATGRMTDPEEIKRMQEAADYLELPSALDGPLKKK